MIDFSGIDKLKTQTAEPKTPKQKTQHQASLPATSSTPNQNLQQPDHHGSGWVKINQAIQQGQEPVRALLVALEVLRDLTGGDFFHQETSESARVVYGALKDPGAIYVDIEQTKERIRRLEEAHAKEDNIPDKGRIKNAIEAHKNRIQRLLNSV